MSKQLSLLCPDREEKLHKLSQTAIHDLGMDSIIGKLSDKPKEREYIRNVMRFLPADPHTVTTISPSGRSFSRSSIRSIS